MWEKEKNLRYYIRNSERADLCLGNTPGVLFSDRFYLHFILISTDEARAKKLHKISSKYAEKRKNLLGSFVKLPEESIDVWSQKIY